MTERIAGELAGSEWDGFVCGHGPGLVLAHGASSDVADSFGAVAARLADTNTVVALNYPGSGTTPRSRTPLTLDGLADSLADAATRAGQRRFAVLGYSTGSAVAVRLATRHPERVTALVLSAGMAYPNPRLRMVTQTWRRLAAAGDPQSLAAYLILLGWSPAWLDLRSETELSELTTAIGAALPPGADDQLDLLTRVDVRAELADIRVPTLIVAATHDLVVSPAHARELAAGIPNAVLTEVDSGHALASERPAEWAEVVATWLRACGA
ncbi:alpha/beta hydrolase [Nocardia sp. NPDC051832]|uniref:alpha/beta fold hydrolase n=1 Tax=Nocardia sp. NPDC051832 TaxID=3155673 RepID=UPI00343BBB1B